MMNSLPLQTRQTLKSLGFSDHECKLLLPLFAHHKLLTKELSQQTMLSFDTVHYTLHALEKKGLVTRTSKSGEDSVEICSNKEFLQWIEKQKKINSDIYDEAGAVLQTFLTTLGESSWKPDVIYFEGVEGVKEIYEDMIREGKDIYTWTDIQKIYENLGEYMEDFIEKRMEKHITSHAIMPMNVMNSSYAKKNQLRNTKFSKDLKINGEIRIYGDKVAVITFHDKKPVGFVFSGPLISSIFKGVFDHAWNACTAFKQLK